jgi:HlyD family secretion protein
VRPTRWAALFAGVLVLAAGGYTLAVKASPRTGAAGEQAGEPRAVTIQRRDIRSTVLATGVVRPKVGAEVQVGSRASGVLQRLHVTVGDRVTAGQLLAELDPTERQARVDQAAAQLATARATLAYATAEYERATPLVKGDVITRAEFDAVKRSFDMATAQMAETEALLRSAEIELGYTRIHAPIAGVVAGVATQVGETVAASFAAPTFVSIIDLDRLEVWAYVDETEIGRVDVGQTASFTVDTYPGVQFGATVYAIQPKAEIIDNVVNYVTRLEITDRQGRTLRPEMTTTVNIVVDTEQP